MLLYSYIITQSTCSRKGKRARHLSCAARQACCRKLRVRSSSENIPLDAYSSQQVRRV